MALAVDLSLLSSVQSACVRHGGFVRGAERFDARTFGISAAEASAMDPQQRMLLEYGYSAFHMSSVRRVTLMGSDGGVFLGIERPDWVLAQPPSTRSSVYAVTSDNQSVAAGRISFVLGMQGPCLSVDAACSSSLVALQGGVCAVRDSECVNAVNLAVSLKLVPYVTLGLASAGMLSADGRCKTLDARANGYVRTEGVGAIVATLSIVEMGLLLLGGLLVRQDGRSASLTAPNGSAQRVLLLGALSHASVSASEVASMEAHGTGTVLGDPTEVGALVASHGGCATPVGAAKASVGHSEAPSGFVGLLKVRQQIVASAAAGNALLRTLNPLVVERLDGISSPFLLHTQHGAASGRVGGVSSFGYSGTIAHAVLR